MKFAKESLQPGHELNLLQGGSAYFPALIRAIDAAQSEVLLETYIFDFVGAGSEVASALVHAARRGVSVCMMVDGVGTPTVPVDWRQRFDGAGVQWHIFSPLGHLGLLIPSRWRRLHRKLCVIDQTLAFCGGINVLDDLHDPHFGRLQAPRFDFAVQVRGPLVAQMHDTMNQLWWRTQAMRMMRERNLAGAWESVRWAGKAQAQAVFAPEPRAVERRATGKAVLLLRDNILHRRTIERAYLQALGAAREDVILANAYFLPGGKLRRALIHAAQRGVRVRVLLQGRYEYFMQYHAARPVYASLLAAGVEIYEYAPSFLHAKVAVIDAATRQPWATVGSSNLDPLSLLLAREANVIVVQRRLARELKTRLELAMSAAGARLDPARYANRNWLARGLGWLAYGLMRLALILAGQRY